MHIKLTAASMFAGDSSFGLESMEIMLSTILSTYKSNEHIPHINFTEII